MEDKTRKIAIAAIILALIGLSNSQSTGNFINNSTFVNQTVNTTIYLPCGNCSNGIINNVTQLQTTVNKICLNQPTLCN
jgi:hypothetical protein